MQMPEEVRTTESPTGKSPEGASGITEPLGQGKGEAKADSLVTQYVAQVPSDDLRLKLMHAAAGTRRTVYIGVTTLTMGFAGIIAKVAWALPPEVAMQYLMPPFNALLTLVGVGVAFSFGRNTGK